MSFIVMSVLFASHPTRLMGATQLAQVGAACTVGWCHTKVLCA